MTENSSEPQFGIRTLDYPAMPIKMRIESKMEADYRITACAKEPWTVEFIEQQPPGSWFIDVGANVGSYTLIAAARGLKVVAIEPHIHNANRLAENLELNNLADRVMIMVAGLANQTGSAYFSMADLRPGYNDHVFGQHKSVIKRPEIWHTHIIPMLRLDDLLPILRADGPIAMKIDVDGVEGAVLQGAIETLQGTALHAIMLELGRTVADTVLSDFERLGWKIVRRIDENSNLGTGGDPQFGKQRFRDMFYVELRK